MSQEKYKYLGNRDANNTATRIQVKEECYSIGDEIPLTAQERDRLAQYFVLENSRGKEFGEGETPPTVSTTPETPASPDRGRIQGAPGDDSGKAQGNSSKSQTD